MRGAPPVRRAAEVSWGAPITIDGHDGRRGTYGRRGIRTVSTTDAVRAGWWTGKDRKRGGYGVGAVCDDDRADGGNTGFRSGATTHTRRAHPARTPGAHTRRAHPARTPGAHTRRAHPTQHGCGRGLKGPHEVRGGSEWRLESAFGEAERRYGAGWGLARPSGRSDAMDADLRGGLRTPCLPDSRPCPPRRALRRSRCWRRRCSSRRRCRAGQAPRWPNPARTKRSRPHGKHPLRLPIPHPAP